MKTKPNQTLKVKKKPIRIENVLAATATGADLKASRRRCWSPPCRNRAWIYDWAGWHYCLKHWWSSYRWGGGEVSIKSFIFQIRHSRWFNFG